jgi:hypothetical protein
MTTALSGINCSIEPNGRDVSKATAARVDIAGVLSAAVVLVGRAATRHVTATVTTPRANSPTVKRFIRILPESVTVAHCKPLAAAGASSTLFLVTGH